MNGDHVTPETERIKKRYDDLKGSRGVWEEHWEDIAEYISPRKRGFTGFRTPGERRTQRIYDNTGGHSLELLAAGLHGMATSPAARWFSLRVTDDQINQMDEVKLYLSEVEKRMWAAMYAPGTNFTTCLHELYLDISSFGTGLMYMGQRDNGGLLFHTCELAESLVDENNEGTVDTVLRCRRYTVRQMMQMLGWSPSETVRKKYDDKHYDDPVAVIHAVYPRKERDPTRKGVKDMPYASLYFEHGTGHLLEESGYPEFPYSVPRWSKVSGEVYGRSPGMTALSDVKMLQAMTRTVIVAGQKVADPPTFLPDDGVVGPVRLIPGGLNFYRGQREIFQLPTSQGLPITLEMLESTRNMIRQTFYVDVLQFVGDADMTATEATYRMQEKMRLMGPLIGRLEAELLGPLIARVFGILNRIGKLPEMPEVLSEREFTVEYVSPLATAQKQSQTQGVMQALQMVGMLGPEIAGPAIQKKVNAEQLIEYFWDVYNNDPKLLNDEEAVEAANQQQQTMQAVQMGVPAADMVQKGAGAMKALADAQAGGGVDFAQLLGSMANDPGAQDAADELSDQASQGVGV